MAFFDIRFLEVKVSECCLLQLSASKLQDVFLERSNDAGTRFL